MATFSDRLRDLLNGKYAERIPELKAKLENGGTLSNEDIGKLAGTSKQTVGNWVDGTSPKAEFLIQLADSYKVTVDWLLGRSDEDTPLLQQEYEPFKDLGISHAAYKNLLALKAQGEDLSAMMVGINHLLEESTTEEVYGEDDPETFETEVIGEQLYLPIVDELNKFFSLYPTGTDVKLQSGAVEQFVASLEQLSSPDRKSIEEVFLRNIIVDNPSDTDNAHLSNLEFFLKQLKGKVVSEKLAALEKESSKSTFTAGKQLNALLQLNEYYNRGK